MGTASSLTRTEMLEQVAARLAREVHPHPTRVAIDGVDAAGKSTLADDLVPFVAAHGRPVLRASVDHFHRPRAQRYRQGSRSPKGYFQDSFDYDTLLSVLLLPLGPGGDRRYQAARFDHRADAPLPVRWELAPPDAILLMDGIFLLRPRLLPQWEVRLFVRVGAEERLARMLARDAETAEERDLLRQLDAERYEPGQRLYLASVQPERLADIVVHNDEPARPSLRFQPRPSEQGALG